MSTMGMTGELKAKVTRDDFGTTPSGAAVEIYTLTSAAISVRIMTLGARVVSIFTPDRSGAVADVVLGATSAAAYLEGKNAYFGAIVGRYGNRIANGRFSLDGRTYQIARAAGMQNSLHGGAVGFDSVIWTGRVLEDGVEMTLVSPDGDQGFPGQLTARVSYTLRGNALSIRFMSTTDMPTVLNLTSHSYFNLGGEGEGLITDEIVTIDADYYVPTDAASIPTGEIASVAGTPFDLRKPTLIGADIDAQNEQLQSAGGYDHCWVLNGSTGELRPAARIEDSRSGRVLTVMTTEPGVQFYTGNFLDGSRVGPSGRAYVRRSGLCLETQHFPDSPNHANFPSTELRPGETRQSETIFAFTTVPR